MSEDSIIAEVHRAREQVWEECGRNADRLMARLRASEERHPEQVVSLEEVRRRQAESDRDLIVGRSGAIDFPAENALTDSPMIAEIREIRRNMHDEFGGDIQKQAFAKDLEPSREAASSDRIDETACERADTISSPKG